MQKLYAGLCGFLVALSSANVHAQWVPVTSNIRFTREILADGKLVTRQVKDGLFYRTDNGSTLTHWTHGDLDPKQPSGELFDNQKVLTYQVFYEAKKAVEEAPMLSAPRRPDYDMDLKPVGSDSVEGVPCDTIAVEFAGPKMKQQRVGSACVARDLGLMLKQETTFNKPNGTTIHTLLEMHDIKLNVPPDKNEFDIVQTFAISKKPDNRAAPRPE